MLLAHVHLKSLQIGEKTDTSLWFATSLLQYKHLRRLRTSEEEETKEKLQIQNDAREEDSILEDSKRLQIAR